MWFSPVMLPLALAAPRFVADEPADALVAERAWQAAVACTGRDPSATVDASSPPVHIYRTVIPGGWLGRAHVDHAQELLRIDVSAPAARIAEVIEREIGSAK